MLPPQIPPPGRPMRARPAKPQPAVTPPMSEPVAPPPERCERCGSPSVGGICQNYGCESPVGKVPEHQIAAHLRPVPGKSLVPATPARGIPLTKKQKHVTAAEEVAFATVEVEMGGRQKLVSTLSTAQLPADIGKVLGAIADPENDKVSLAKVCAQHDVSLAQLLKIFQAALLARGQLQAQVRIATKLPDVAAAVMDAAVERDDMCPKCLGAKQVEELTKGVDGIETSKMIECTKCHGIGTVHHTPDHDVQKTALKLGKLLESGGMRIAVNQQTIAMGGGADAGSYDKLIGALDTALYGHGRDRLQSGPEGDTLDGETIDGPHLEVEGDVSA